MVKTKIVRTGNSRAVILPTAVLESQHLDAGDEVEIEELVHGVVIRLPGKRSARLAGLRVIRDHMDIIRGLAKR
jgi:antitoxin component of MazEF toxin-antitoxin module